MTNQEFANFLISFDTKGLTEVTRGIKDLQNQLRTTDGVMARSGAASGKMGAGIMALGAKAMGILAPLIAVGKVISDAFAINREILQLHTMAETAGVAAASIEKLALASQRYGGTTQSAGRTMANLSQNFLAISQGQMSSRQVEALARFGGTQALFGPSGTLASPEEFLKNMARLMQGQHASVQQELGQAFGLDDATIRLLSRGLEGYTAAIEQASRQTVMSTEKALRQAEELQASQQELRAAWQKFLVEITPLLTMIVQLLTPLVEIISWVGSLIQSLVNALNGVLRWFRRDGDHREYFERAGSGRALQSLTWANAKDAMSMVTNPLGAMMGMGRGRGGLNYESNVQIGTVVVEDRSGTIRGKTDVLSRELRDRFGINDLSLSPAVLARAFK